MILSLLSACLRDFLTPFTDPKIVSGVATWIGVILVGVAVHLLTRRSSRLAIDWTGQATA